MNEKHAKRLRKRVRALGLPSAEMVEGKHGNLHYPKGSAERTYRNMKRFAR